MASKSPDLQVLDVDQAKLTWMRFYQELERYLKRHQPIDWAPAIARRVETCSNKVELWAQTPPHSLLHSIEANCAYARGQNKDPVDFPKIARVMNAYIDFDDPMISYLLTEEKNLTNFGIVMYRQQMELQYRPDPYDIAQGWFLFASNHPLMKTSVEFENNHGLTMEQWFRSAFLAYTLAVDRPDFMRCKIPGDLVIDLSDDQFRSYLRLASFTPGQIAQRFKENRAETRHRFHTCIRSVFLERPLMDFGEDRFLAPKPELIMRHASEGIYRLAKQCYPRFNEELGPRFEEYIGQVLASTDGIRSWLDERKISNVVGGKSCDFLLELDDCVALFECKAAIMSARILIEDVLRKDNSTAKIQHGMLQLYETAHAIKSGAFERLGVSSTKPIVGFVVILGHVSYPNSPWYRERILMPGVEEKLEESASAYERYPQCPVVLSSRGLEHLITALNQGHELTSLLDEKASRSQAIIGDWIEFLGHHVQDRLPLGVPKITIQNYKGFISTMGAGLEQLEQVHPNSLQ